MKINCPHCHNPINLVDGKQFDELTCPSCGSHVTLYDVQTVAYLQPGAKAGRFELVELLGSGKFGDVWLAKDEALGRQVAIKVPRKDQLDAADIALFAREARAVAQLKHPNIVAVYEVGTDNDRIYIVSELIRGPNLAEWLETKRLTGREVANLCAKLADGLNHAHEHGIIHRDLKPSNVLMDDALEPHITDFGLARREDGGEITITVDGKVLGTPAYMSPEQARGDAHTADGRSDVYSLGVMLFEMLTGQRPFNSRSRMLIYQVIHDEPPMPRKIRKAVDRDLQTICLKSMRKDPARRYQTAREMADDLRNYLDGRPILARPITCTERTWMWAKRSPLVASLTALSSLLLVALCGLLAYQALVPPRPIVPPPFTQNVELTSDPPGAHIHLFPIDRSTGLPDAEHPIDAGISPVSMKLRPGDYLVVADKGKEGFHEVFRHIPDENEKLPERYRHLKWKTEAAKNRIVLEPVEIFPLDFAETEKMARFDGAERFAMGSAALSDAPRHFRAVPPFFLDTTELSMGGFRFTRHGKARTLPDELREANLTDEDAIPWLSHDRAMEVAETMGKRLQDETEYEFAATEGGRADFPSGRAPDDWPYGPAGMPASDQVRAANGREVFGLYSNLAEWTANKFAPYPNFPNPEFVQPFMTGDYAMYRGGPHSVAIGAPNRQDYLIGPRMRNGDERRKGKPRLGVRMARSTRPRTLPGDFIRIVPD